jgi:hypothetical protein
MIIPSLHLRLTGRGRKGTCLDHVVSLCVAEVSIGMRRSYNKASLGSLWRRERLVFIASVCSLTLLLYSVWPSATPAVEPVFALRSKGAIADDARALERALLDTITQGRSSSQHRPAWPKRIFLVLLEDDIAYAEPALSAWRDLNPDWGCEVSAVGHGHVSCPVDGSTGD